MRQLSVGPNLIWYNRFCRRIQGQALKMQQCIHTAEESFVEIVVPLLCVKQQYLTANAMYIMCAEPIKPTAIPAVNTAYGKKYWMMPYLLQFSVKSKLHWIWMLRYVRLKHCPGKELN